LNGKKVFLKDQVLEAPNGEGRLYVPLIAQEIITTGKYTSSSSALPAFQSTPTTGILFDGLPVKRRLLVTIWSPCQSGSCP
jgi:hypothetical protein